MLIKDFAERKSRSELNQYKVLSHIRDCTFTSAAIVSLCLNQTLSAAYKILNRFESQGLLRKHHCRELRLTLWGLTDHGILMSWAEDEAIEHRMAFQPSKLSPLMVNHEIQLQQAKIQALRIFGWENWVFGSHISGQLEKRPDAIVTSPDGLRFACELERFSKSRNRLEVIISIYLRSIKRGDYDFIAYIAPSKDMALRLKRLFRSISSVPVAGQKVVLTEKHYSRFKFFELEHWPLKEV